MSAAGAVPARPVPPMLWIGGIQGAGKSTIAEQLARRWDLPCQHVDAFTYAHLPRMHPVPQLHDQLARGTDHAVAMWHRVSAERVPLVIEDIHGRGVGGVPTLVEGPQLTPSTAGSLAVLGAVWLLASPARTQQVRRARAVAAQDAAAQARVEQLARRDEAVLRQLRAALEAAGSVYVQVADRPDWSLVVAQVEEALAVALAAAPRLQAGEPLRRQRAYENAALAHQGLLWQRAEGIRTLPSAEFACECGRSGCVASRRGTPEGYQRAALRGPVLAIDHVAV
ncbi:hypothetical protein PZ938_14580 [Luteipulveratus sp. YIM 133132]|uniref:UDP-N-acetylglucosamine kinase n=1 Tax=Luteipulveratus flavus TaxID=3031728 RepID=A0ABT6CEZ3_9MICO|nr:MULTISPECIES: hypothetical protein [unclassified Luteipulveratus]MDE9366838.1 hypothetical protein [Luteipulveratus sp. YIM 133132]MDF8265871.1 hypothetical protein [Luteipulveratus sp. YIM 133296]